MFVFSFVSLPITEILAISDSALRVPSLAYNSEIPVPGVSRNLIFPCGMFGRPNGIPKFPMLPSLNSDQG